MKKNISYIFVLSIGYFLAPQSLLAQWSELGGTNSLNANNSLFSMCNDPAENVYVVGAFTNASGYYVAKYDTSWSDLGAPNGLAANNEIYAVCSDASGNIYTGGRFTNSSGNRYIAKYDGTSWSELGGLNSFAPNDDIVTICCDSAGNIYAAGSFTNSSGMHYVAKYDGTSWSELGGLNGLSANDQILSICSDGAGNIYAVGFFTVSATFFNYVAVYDGTTWSQLGGAGSFYAIPDIRYVTSDAGGNIYAGGFFMNGNNKQYVAKFDGTTWSEVGGANGLAANNGILVIHCDKSGNIYAGGCFTNSSVKYYVAKYDGTSWSELGGLNGLAADGYVLSICTDTSGNVYASGDFDNSNFHGYVAKYHSCNSYSNSNITSCNSYTSAGGNTYTSSGIYHDTIPNAAGCDSLITIILTINPLPVALYTLYPDTTTPHNWFALNQCTGIPPLSYVWNWGDSSAVSTGATPSHTYADSGYYNICVTVTDGNGCVNTYCDSSTYIYKGNSNSMITLNVVMSLPNGIENIDGNSAINISPNPVNDVLNVSLNKPLPAKSIITINDVQGRAIKEEKISQSNSSVIPIDVSSLSQGVYLLTLNGRVQRFVKM